MSDQQAKYIFNIGKVTGGNFGDALPKSGVANIVPDQSRRRLNCWQPRKDEVKEIKMWLENKVNLIGIKGFGGYGKSTLASYIFEDKSLIFDQRIWINFSSQTYNFNQIGNWLLGELTKNQNGLEQIIDDTQLINNLHHQMCTKSIFLVFDNLETLLNNQQWLDNSYYKFLIKWIEYGENSQILLTTREQPDLPINESYKWLNLTGLTPESSIELLTQQKVQGRREDLLEVIVQ